MERNSQCPDCGRGLKLGARSCSSCGWEAPALPGQSRAKALQSPDHGNCEWVSASAGKCRFPGAISDGTHGDAPFYCCWHFWDRDPQYAEHIVRQSREWDGSVESYLEMRRQRATRNEKAPPASRETIEQVSRLLGIRPPAQSEPGERG